MESPNVRMLFIDVLVGFFIRVTPQSHPKMLIYWFLKSVDDPKMILTFKRYYIDPFDVVACRCLLICWLFHRSVCCKGLGVSLPHQAFFFSLMNEWVSTSSVVSTEKTGWEDAVRKRIKVTTCADQRIGAGTKGWESKGRKLRGTPRK